MLNPHGHGSTKFLDLLELWKCIAERSKAATSNSELAATVATSGEYRVEVGMSRVAESLLVAFEQLKEPVYANVTIEKQLNATLVEVARLEPTWLDAGKGSKQQEEETTSDFNMVRVKAARSSTRRDAAPSQEALAEAANVLHG